MENQNEVKQKKKMGCLPKLGIGLLVLVVIGIIFGDSESTTTHESTVADSQLSEGVKEEPKKEIEEEPKKEVEEETPVEDTTEAEEDNKVEPVSLEFKNALGKANDYLAFTSFSESGLKDQLEFEGFSKESIDYAIENVSVDWKEQAAKKAADYLKLSSFSKQGLKDQLEFEGFTNEEVSYGLEAVGY